MDQIIVVAVLRECVTCFSPAPQSYLFVFAYVGEGGIERGREADRMTKKAHQFTSLRHKIYIHYLLLLVFYWHSHYLSSVTHNL